MGVQGLFIQLVKNQNYRDINTVVVPGECNCDYLLLDFNQIVYTSFYKIQDKIVGKNLTKQAIETEILKEMKRYLKHFVCEVVQPKKVLYIAVDGPAPRAKMVQQRSRRYSKILQKNFIKDMRKKYNMPDDNESWDASANIAPGTLFMSRLTQELMEMMEARLFNEHNENMEVIFSTSEVPGEAEHKLMPIIRNLARNNRLQDDVVYIDSKDADLVILSMMTHKNNIHIIRLVSGESDAELKRKFDGHEYHQMNIDALRDGWSKELTKNNQFEGVNPIRVLNDYNFLASLSGNDFVSALQFMKVNKDGLKLLKTIYNEVKRNHTNFLVDYDPMDPVSEPRINNAFLKDIFVELAKREDREMKKEYHQIKRAMKGERSEREIEQEADKTPYENEVARYEHTRVCSQVHPLYNQYFTEFLQIDYTKEKNEWKKEYYEYFLGVDRNNMEEFNRRRVEMVINYLESLVFVLRYYFKGVPSWHWHYKYRVCPLPSDIVYVMQNVMQDINSIQFTVGHPYTPYQQLMMIYPIQNVHLIPEILRPIMTDINLGCVQFYPEEYRYDVFAGIKTIYSEIILPEINEDILIPIIREKEESLTENERKRNTIKNKPIKFTNRT